MTYKIVNTRRSKSANSVLYASKNNNTNKLHSNETQSIGNAS